MKKSDIKKLRIDIMSGQESALSMLLGRDGTLGRQGSGKLPADKTSVLGIGNKSIFNSLINMLDERVLPHAAVYDHPNKIGVPITWSIFWVLCETQWVIEFHFSA